MADVVTIVSAYASADPSTGVRLPDGVEEIMLEVDPSSNYNGAECVVKMLKHGGDKDTSGDYQTIRLFPSGGVDGFTGTGAQHAILRGCAGRHVLVDPDSAPTSFTLKAIPVNEFR